MDDAVSDSGSTAPGGGLDGNEIVAVSSPDGHIARGEMCLMMAWVGTLYANLFVSSSHTAFEAPSSSANFLWMMTVLGVVGVAQMFANNITCKACMNAHLPLMLLSTSCVMVEVCLVLNLVRDIRYVVLPPQPPLPPPSSKLSPPPSKLFALN